MKFEVNQISEEIENPNMQTKASRVSKESDEEKNKQILQQLQTQRKKWHHDNRNALCWSFYCVNDNLKVNLDVPQMMCCLLCQFQPVFYEFKKTIKERFSNIL